MSVVSNIESIVNKGQVKEKTTEEIQAIIDLLLNKELYSKQKNKLKKKWNMCSITEINRFNKKDFPTLIS